MIKKVLLLTLITFGALLVAHAVSQAQANTSPITHTGSGLPYGGEVFWPFTEDNLWDLNMWEEDLLPLFQEQHLSFGPWGGIDWCTIQSEGDPADPNTWDWTLNFTEEAPIFITWQSAMLVPPPILVSIVMHNEEPLSGLYPDFVNNEPAFWQHRDALVQFVDMLHDNGVMFNYQSDWNFLMAAGLYDTGTPETNGENIVRYIKDLGFEVDPHAHETQYNYADVAYLIDALGVTPSHTTGGFQAHPPEDSKLGYLWQPITATLSTTYTWQAEILWGGATLLHQNEEALWASGVWKPKDNEHFMEHDDVAPLTHVGGYGRDCERLVQKQQSGELEEGKIHTCTIFVGQKNLLQPGFIQGFEQRIQALNAAGDVRWVGLAQVIDIWQTEYDSEPNILRYLTPPPRVYLPLILKPFVTPTSTPTPTATSLPLTWQLEPGLRVSGDAYADPQPHIPLAPDVIQLDDGSRFGRYRMFYSVTGLGIGSATSDDGFNWTVEPGLRLESRRMEGELYFDVGHPTVVRLADGRWRMYYQTSTGIDTPLRLVSAISSDGFNFTQEEGVRIDIGPDSELSFAGHGRAWRAADGSFWMLLSANTHDDTGPSDIALATSPDGLTWTIVEPHLFVDGHDPTLLINADGSVTALWMYLDQTFCTSDSADGLQWSPPVEVLFYDQEGQLLNYSSDPGGDVALLRLDDRSLRLFTNWSDGIRSLVPTQSPILNSQSS